MAVPELAVTPVRVTRPKPLCPSAVELQLYVIWNITSGTSELITWPTLLMNCKSFVSSQGKEPDGLIDAVTLSTSVQLLPPSVETYKYVVVELLLQLSPPLST
jgi:hypothetical protein